MGAVLGILVGIMVGLYGLPALLQSLYGERRVAAGEVYEGDGRVIAVEAVGFASEPLGDASPGMQRHDVSLRLVITSNKTWRATLADWTLEVYGIETWIPAASATTDGAPGFAPPLGRTSTVVLNFIVERPAGAGGQPRLVALHLGDPRVRFALE